jgi:hypothetical protein
MAMTPDTRSILTSLRFMKDSELQQYAAMHKNDPFIFPLAFQESQMRKQVRAEEQAKQQQPQAKVVDQNLAAMAAEPLPEDVGIAQLPAKNLEGIATGAAGGIVAFDEGGEVPRYQNQGLVQYPGMLPMEGGTVLPTTSGFEGMSMSEFLDTLRRKAKGTLSDYFSKEREKANAQAMYGGPKVPTKADIAALGNVGGFNTAYAAVPPVTDTPSAAPADQGGKTPPPPAAPPKAPTVAPTTFKPAEAPSIASAKELAGQLLDAGEYKKNIQDYQKAEQDAIDAARKAREEGKPKGKAYEEYESTLRDEMADLGKQKGEAQGEAWLTAGLAVLGGASPYALQNLSLATKGVEQYRDAMKDIRKATRENAKGLADIAQARRAEERGDWEKTQEFEERASTRMSNARKFGVEGIMGLGIKNAELAGRAYDTQITQAGMDRRTFAELQSREKIANAQLGAPSGIEKLVSRIQADPKFAEAYEKYASIGPSVRGEYGALQKYMTPQGEMSLRMLEAGTPEQKAQAKAIRQKLQTMWMTPVEVSSALP